MFNEVRLPKVSMVRDEGRAMYFPLDREAHMFIL